MRPLHLLLAFLVAVIVGRLSLEPSGVGIVLLALMLPALAIAVAALAGWRAGLLFFVFAVPLAVGARLVFQTVPGQAWLALILAPVAVALALIAVSVARTLWSERRAERSPGREREEEEE